LTNIVSDRAENCFVCGAGVRGNEPGIPEEYYPTLWCHAACLNSPEGIAWRERQKAADPGYDRYLRLSTVGLRVECPACGFVCCLSAKARGMAAGSWEACCLACSRVTFLDGYRYEREYEEITAAEHVFLFDASRDDWRRRVEEIAITADPKLHEQSCPCGSRFSLAAAPRCPGCRAVLLDSFFHYAYAP
jgi:hypothetical protein